MVNNAPGMLPKRTKHILIAALGPESKMAGKDATRTERVLKTSDQ
jgi:hypothetical protein